MIVYSYRKTPPELKVDFLAIFRNNKAIRYPFIIYKNKKLEIKEDNLGIMINKIVNYFGKLSTSNILTLNKYLPVAKHQIYLERLLHKNVE